MAYRPLVEPCPRPLHEWQAPADHSQHLGILEALETEKVLLNAGEDFVQWNLATIVERRRL